MEKNNSGRHFNIPYCCVQNLIPSVIPRCLRTSSELELHRHLHKEPLAFDFATSLSSKVQRRERMGRMERGSGEYLSALEAVCKFRFNSSLIANSICIPSNSLAATRELRSSPVFLQLLRLFLVAVLLLIGLISNKDNFFVL